jgi:protein-S-isoprenylcysteine O-methyltransferase Ste14
MLAGGIGLALWATASAGDADVERDEALITRGAYALSRNPMYVGWSAGVLGLVLWTRSLWLLAGWILAVRALDREIEREESRLLDRFGPIYRTYRDQVPRYLVHRGP